MGMLEICLRERERFTDPEAGTPQHNDKRTETQTVRSLAGFTHHLNYLLDPRWIRWIAVAPVTWGSSGVEAGQGGW